MTVTDHLLAEHQRQYAAVRAFLEAAALGDRADYIASLDALDWPAAWHEVFRGIVALGHVHPDAQQVFAAQWVGLSDLIPAGTPNGKRLRRIFEAETRLLMDGLRLMLPPTNAQPGTIYRGLPTSDFENGDLGLSWTMMPLIAEFYARHMAPGSEPGIVLSASCPAAAIIGGTDTDEIVVDPRLLDNVQVICRPKAKFVPWQAGEGYIGQCETLGIEHQRQTNAVEAFVEAAVLGDRAVYVASLDALNWPEAWIQIFRAIVERGNVHPDTQLTFVDQWKRRLGKFITFPPGGRSLRAIFVDHLDLFIDGLRILLPPLEGEPPQVIFRGQSIEEHRAGIVGLSWSPRPTTAEFYARNKIVNTGETVVVASFFPADAIIGEIDASEVVVDPRKIKKPKIVLQSKSKFRPTAKSGEFLDQCETLALFDLIPCKSGQRTDALAAA